MLVWKTLKPVPESMPLSHLVRQAEKVLKIPICSNSHFQSTFLVFSFGAEIPFYREGTVESIRRSCMMFRGYSTVFSPFLQQKQKADQVQMTRSARVFGSRGSFDMFWKALEQIRSFPGSFFPTRYHYHTKNLATIQWIVGISGKCAPDGPLL